MPPVQPGIANTFQTMKNVLIPPKVAAWKLRYNTDEWAFLCEHRKIYRSLMRVIPGEKAPFRNWLARKREALFDEFLHLQNSGKNLSDYNFQLATIEKYVVSTSRRKSRPMSAQLFREHYRKLLIQQLGILVPEPSVINCLICLQMMDTVWSEDQEYFIYVPEEVMKEWSVLRGRFPKTILTPFFVFRRFGNGLLHVTDRLMNIKAHELVIERLAK